MTVSDAAFETLMSRVATLEGRGVPLMSSLPAEVPLGGLIRLLVDAVSGIEWMLGWNGTTRYWDFLGGAPLFSEVTANESTSSDTFTALATAGPAIVIPAAGDYGVAIGARAYASANSTNAVMAYDIGGAAAVDADAIDYWGGTSYDGSTATVVPSAFRERSKTLTAVTLTAKYKSSVGAGSGFFSNRWMRVLPSRLGPV